MKALLRGLIGIGTTVALLGSFVAEAQVPPELPPTPGRVFTHQEYVAIAAGILKSRRSVEKWSAAAQVVDLAANGAIVASIAAIGATAPVGSLPGILCLAGAGVINVAALLTDLRAKNLDAKTDLMERQFREMAGSDADKYFREAMFEALLTEGANVPRNSHTVPGVPGGAVSSGGAAGAGMPR